MKKGTTACAPRRPPDDGLSTSAFPFMMATAVPPRQTIVGLLTSSPVWAVDPGQRSGSTILHPDGRVEKGVDFLTFVETLSPGSVVVTESTVHAYRLSDRRALIARADTRGVALWAMRSIFTSRGRKALQIEKSDENDARAIKYLWDTKGAAVFYRLRQNPAYLGTVNEAGTPRFEVNRRLVALRRQKYPGYPGHAEATADILAKVSIEFRLTSRSFDRLTGFHATGYPNLARSNRNMHSIGRKHPELRKDKMRDVRRLARRRRTVLMHDGQVTPTDFCRPAHLGVRETVGAVVG